MIVIGLVGQMASGKSTVARMLAEHGAEVIDADALARDALDDPAVRQAVVDRFGRGVVADDGGLRRDRLAEQVFGSTADHAAALAALEAIIHPEVRHRIEARLDAIRSEEGCGNAAAIVVLDVPLLVQVGWADRCDVLMRIVCDDAVRANRLVARNLSAEQQRQRDAAWSRDFRESDMPPEKTMTVDAGGDLAYTRNQVDLVWERIRSRPDLG
ncbi:MAG: dephospho-CoA kinase [Planctomycetota bacterium]|jgi:dephospho-CoA kinase|nr:dephospho-CoA kinase [Planctomycetota bacterium]